VVHDDALGDVEVRPAATVCNTNQRIDSFERKRMHPMRRRHLLGGEPPDVQLDSLFVALFHALLRYMACANESLGFGTTATVLAGADHDLQIWRRPNVSTARPSE